MSTETERWERFEAIFRAVADAPPEECAARLDELCGDDAALRREVESMLAAQDRAGGFMEAPLPELLSSGDPGAGRVVGRWRLLEHIGSGGMGAVYLAERADGAYEQRAALKLIAAHVGGGDPRRRFLHERQILASLEHPNIARLLDGGVTEEGQPYLVMEHVAGRPVTEHADDERLGLRERLKLFLEVCTAVQHAHGQLIVHRDLKPSNILVAADGTVKLLDFGIAKVVGADEGAPQVTVTEGGAGPLTPSHASPEQIRGGRVTTASDVYSLGVILYELLTGRRPYEVETGSREDYARAMETQEPARPSSAVTRPRSLAAAGGAEGDVASPEAPARARRVSPGQLRRALAGDLDTILLTTLRTEPERRYASVERLADDIRRHLDGLPILARPDTLGYRTGKFVRRHRVGVAAAAIVAMALLGGIVATTWQARVADLARQEAEAAQEDAEQARDDAEAVNLFLFNVFRAGDPRAGGESMSIREAMDYAATRIEEEFARRPRAEAYARLSIGMTYRTLTALEQAEPHVERAVELYEQQEGPAGPNTLMAIHELATLRWDQGRLAEAEQLARRALEGRRRSLPPDHPKTIKNMMLLARIVDTTGDSERAAEIMAEALAALQRTSDPADPELLVARKQYAVMLSQLGRAEEAVGELERVLAVQERVIGAGHLDTLVTLSDLASCYSRLERRAEAEAHYRRARDGMAAILPPGHMSLLITEVNLAGEIIRQDRHAEAAELLGDIRDRAEASLGADHWLTCMAGIRMGGSLLEIGRVDEAEAAGRAAHDALERSEGPGWAREEAAELLEKIAQRRSEGQSADESAGPGV